MKVLTVSETIKLLTSIQVKIGNDSFGDLTHDEIACLTQLIVYILTDLKKVNK